MNTRIFVLLMFISFCSGLSLKDNHKTKSSHPKKSWDFLLLSQFWPPTSCYVYFGKEHCYSIPEAITGWTIHGLWPSVPGHDEPYYCNRSETFDYNKIKTLSAQMKMQWYYFNETDDPTFLWKHEYEKHGTCAETLSPLKGEYNYFSKTLQLQKPLDILGVLQKHHVTPSSTKQYKPYDFYDALKAEFGVLPTIACSYDPKSKLHYIEQVYLCFDKTFKPQDCSDAVSVLKEYAPDKLGNLKMHSGGHFSDCPHPDEQSLYYLPIKSSHGHLGDESVNEKTEKETQLHFQSELEETIP